MNKLIEKLIASAGFVRKEKAAIPHVSASGTSDPFTIWRTINKVDPAKALEAYTGWVYACIRAIAMDVMGMKHKLFRVGKDNDEELFDHETLDVLGAVNDYQTGLELKFLVAAHLEATGNAYLFLEGVNDEKTKPLALHVMVPSKVKEIVNREEFPTRIQGYEYRLGTRVYQFKPYQVIHFKYPNPSDPVTGIGTVQQIAQWVDADNYAMEFNRRFFLNGARIGGFLQTDEALTDDQLEYLKTSFEAAFKGVENAYKVLSLPAGVKYEEGGKTQKDLDFANLMMIMRDRIIAGFRVPRTALGITDDVNRANAEATDYVFAKRVIKPIMELITSYLNEFLVPRYGEDLYLSFEDPVPEDRASRMEEVSKATGGAPVMTVNEAREEYFDLEPVKGGDVVQQPFNLVPLGEVEETPPTDQLANGNGKQKLVVRTRFARNARRRRAIADEVGKKAAKEIADIFKGIFEISKKGLPEITQLSDDQYEVVYKGFALRVDRYEKRQKQAIEDFNAKQRKEVIGNLPKILKGFVGSEMKAIDKNDLFDLEESMAALVDLSRPILYDLAGKEGAEAATLLGIPDLDILTPEVRRALDRAIELMSENYNKTTRLLLKEKLEEGLKQGLSQDELADVIDGVYGYSDDVRALAVARTETFRIANYATQEAWKQSGIVNSQKWYTAADERVCPYCSPMHGKVVGIDQDFFKKGDTVTGSDGSRIEVEYSDVGAPPLHVNCRCYIRPEQISLE